MKFKLSQMWSHEKGKNYEGDNNNNYGNGNDNAVHSNMFSIKILEPIAKNIILSIHTLTHTHAHSKPIFLLFQSLKPLELLS